jgi:hypothetical protein
VRDLTHVILFWLGHIGRIGLVLKAKQFQVMACLDARAFERQAQGADIGDL